MDKPVHTAPVAAIARHRLTTDGQGVTTLVAFAGCPLRCRYCLNPHTLDTEQAWPLYDAQRLYDAVRIDSLYFLATQGGITFGGGEPALRSGLIAEFRALCGTEWRLTVETSLNVAGEHIEALLPVVDEFIIDIKDMDPEIYRSYTGRPNDRVIDNLRRIARQGYADRTQLRIPLIPQYNEMEAVERSIGHLRSLGFSHFDRFTYRT